jgi:hypothetical protein
MVYFQLIWKFLLFGSGLLVSVNAFGDDYKASVPLPSCDPQDPKVQFISQDSHWSKINQKDKTIICVSKGDYAVNLSLTTSGTADEPRYIVATGATIDRMYFLNGVKHWIVHGITVDGTVDSSVRMQANQASSIILDNITVENSGGGAGQIATGGENLVIQDSVIRNTKVTPNKDDHCIGVPQTNVNLKIVNNEIYNCAGDGIQSNNGIGTISSIIADNEFYVDSSFYTDGKGNSDPNGDYMYGENALDIKTGGRKSTNYLLIKRNKIWGFDKSTDNTYVSGAGGGGQPVIFHLKADRVKFEENIISGSGYGIVFANPTVKHISIVNNLFSNINIAVFASMSKGDSNEFYYNTVVNAPSLFFGNENANDYKYNVFINVPNLGLTSINSASDFDFNAFYNSDIVGTNSLSTENESLNESYCFTKQHITNPQEVCIPLAVTSNNSLHNDMGTAIETKNRGVDDLPILSREKAGFKPSPFSLIVEAEDYNKKVSHKGPWEIVEDTELSATKGVKAPMPIEPSDHQTSSPRLEYNFVAPTSGIYYIWFRTKASGPGTNSINHTVGGWEI